MLLVDDVPLLERIVLQLRRCGITDIAINLHYRPWTIVSHMGQGQRWGVRIHYSFEEQLLGSAGAAKRLEWYFDESFVVVYGAVYTDMDLTHLIQAHRQDGALVTMALYTTDDPTECVIAELDDRSRVRRFIERPASDRVSSRLANAGIFVVEPEVLCWLPAERYLDFVRHVFPEMLASGHTIFGHIVTETLIDIGTPKNYRRAQRLAVRRAAAGTQAETSSGVTALTVDSVLARFAAAWVDEIGATAKP
jgi:NDP-sugar pyrophosphorylase family protein